MASGCAPCHCCNRLPCGDCRDLARLHHELRDTRERLANAHWALARAERTLRETEEALAACQSEASGKINQQAREIDRLRAELAGRK